MGPSATVPYPFDVIIDGNGYVFADLNEEKAQFGLTPIYVPRTNTQGDYGDNQQDFWLTYAQKDWSQGEGQRYQGRDDAGRARYFKGSNIDVTTPGQAQLSKDDTGITFAANPVTTTVDTVNDRVYVATSTTQYRVIYDGTITSDGAHGLGTSPGRWGMTNDGRAIYMSGTGAGTVGVRKWNGAAFSTFSATAADSLAFLNNTLYGYVVDSNKLIKYDSGGTASDVFLWRDVAADATGYAVQAKLIPYGGKLLILRYRETATRGAELWVYDGTATSKLTEFPASFKAYDVEILSGTVFVSGVFERHISATLYHRPAVFFYKDGQQDILWQAAKRQSAASEDLSPPLTPFDGGMVWVDKTWSDHVMFYNPVLGGVSTVQNLGLSAGNLILQGTSTFYLGACTGTTSASIFPAAAANSSGSIYSSLVDYDTSLQKMFRGIRVDFDLASDGNGGSVDIAYRFNNINDSSMTYTTLQTGAVSGTEYAFSGVSGNTNSSVSVQLVLNKGTSTDGPVLKRMLVRAVPVQPGFKKRQYVLLLGGRDGDSPVVLRDGSPHNLDGKEMATNLETVASKINPVTIVDHLSGPSGFTGTVEDVKMIEYKPEQWIATVSVRQV